jgi:hypothetical protein
MELRIGIDNLLEIVVSMNKNKFDIKDWLEGWLEFK